MVLAMIWYELLFLVYIESLKWVFHLMLCVLTPCCACSVRHSHCIEDMIITRLKVSELKREHWFRLVIVSLKKDKRGRTDFLVRRVPQSVW